jgi:hypothetical protein
MNRLRARRNPSPETTHAEQYRRRLPCYGHAVRSMAGGSWAGGSWVCGDGLDVQGSRVLTGSWRDKQPLQVRAAVRQTAGSLARLHVRSVVQMWKQF